ncbi:MAG: helix-turn-helix domain-containing protein [Promicromonosporaceae bacterium]|nr:helix-turn-helix domain-containing protein [Promicromonosporaceae bacterium]
MRVKDPAQIRRWRKQRHFSQLDLALLARRTQQAISLVESGKMRDLSEGLAVAIASRLDVPLEELFEVHDDTGCPAQQTPRATLLAQNWRWWPR